ncbi:hypothetical protein LEP1GSC020_0832 [Leptospira interrogans serovar Grippotyphosa str. 2006006986]|nr:hypothetical protein LEP1GSC020_0832 [Leptospira interrogans serovar Grippotyphosa str. 2006006986]
MRYISIVLYLTEEVEISELFRELSSTAPVVRSDMIDCSLKTIFFE